jgi:lysophospholipase L1-like esterase
MGNYEQLKQAVADVIKSNGNQEITGAILQNALLTIISTVGYGATFAGIATPTTNPRTPDQNIFYLAAQPGIYSNFGGVELTNQVILFANKNGNWVKQNTGIAIFAKVIEVEAKNNNLTLLDGYNNNDIQVIENFQYLRIKKNIDISDLRVSTVYNDASIPKRVIIKYSNGSNWKMMNMTSNYYSDGDIELYYNWDKHTNNINYKIGLIGILESSKNISINNSLFELSTKPYFSFNEKYFDETIKASELLREIYVDKTLNKDLFFYGVRIKPSDETKLQIAFILESESLYWCIWQVSINEIGKCIYLNSTIGGTKIYVVVDLSKDFFWNPNCAKLNDNIYKINYSPYIFSNIITKNTTSFVYSENNTDNEIKILSCFKQIRILGKYKDLCINTIYNSKSIPKRFIIRTFDNSIEQLIDFSDNHYEGYTKFGYIIIDFDWDYFIANCTNINNTVNKYIIIKSDAFVDKLYDNIKEVKEIKDNIIIPKTEEIQYDEIIQAYPLSTSGKFVDGTQVYAKTAIFQVQKNVKYVISGKTVGPKDVSYCSIMFTNDRESKSGVSLLNTNPSNIGEKIQITYTPESDGFLFVWLYTSVDVPYVIGRKIGYLYIPKENKKKIELLEKSILTQIQNKNLVVLGDSIMMLMRTNSVPSNTITYKDKVGNTHDYSSLTNVSGYLYVTSTLQDGKVVDTSVLVDIVNSSQNEFDLQNWNALKQFLGVQNLYNLGLGGATFAERQIITSYPYPDGNGWTTDLPNEVRWLIRRYDEGNIQYPDCIVIWMGTNGAGRPTSDNYEEIMLLTYDELNSNEHYTERKTLYGGLRWSLETLYRKFKFSTIILVTPVQTNPENYRTYDKLTTTANAIKKMAGRYSCMVFDALNEIGVVDFFEKSDGSGYFLYDGLHPNSKGKILWKNYLGQKLKSLFFCKRDN